MPRSKSRVNKRKAIVCRVAVNMSRTQRNTGSAHLRRVRESVLRLGQAEMVAQHRSLIVFRKQAAPLQFRNDEVDEVIEGFGKMRRHLKVNTPARVNESRAQIEATR
jgi:hypothetical protein